VTQLLEKSPFRSVLWSLTIFQYGGLAQWRESNMTSSPDPSFLLQRPYFQVRPHCPVLHASSSSWDPSCPLVLWPHRFSLLTSWDYRREPQHLASFFIVFLPFLSHRRQRHGWLGRWHPCPRDPAVAGGPARWPGHRRAHQPDGRLPHRGPAGGRPGAPGQVGGDVVTATQPGKLQHSPLRNSAALLAKQLDAPQNFVPLPPVSLGPFAGLQLSGSQDLVFLGFFCSFAQTAGRP
jgi:hypothetical protein